MAETMIVSVGNAAARDGDLEHLVPTLYIGLGGSGKEVLMRLRKRFYDRYTLASTDFTRYLAIDTDTQPFVPQNESGEAFAPVALSPEEQIGCQITDESFYDVFKGIRLRHDPRYTSWLSLEMEKRGAKACKNGAGTNRPFGRMAFFLNYATIRARLIHQLEQAVAKPRIPAAFGPTAQVDTNRLEVVIATSLAGGTGSGMFIDVAYLVQDIFRTHHALKNLTDKYVTLIAFLPWMFGQKAGDMFDRFKQNAYAALLEMEYYGTPRSGDEMFLGKSRGNGADDLSARQVGFEVNWEGKDRPDFIPDCAWNTAYLIDCTNNFNANNPLKAHEVFQMAADYLSLDFGNNAFAIAKRSARSNLVQYLQKIKLTRVRKLPGDASHQTAASALQAAEDVLFEGHNGCTFSSFGLSEVAIDVGRVQRAAAYRLAMSLIRQHWRRDTEQVGRVAQKHFNKWAREDLVDGRQLPAERESPVSFLPDELSRHLLQLQNADWRQRVEGELANAGGANPADTWNALRQVLQSQRQLLAPARQGSDAGQGWQDMQKNFERLVNTPGKLGPLRERLERLAKDRVTNLGVSISCKLFETYHKTFDQVIKAAKQSREAGLPAQSPKPRSLERLEEARSLPGFVRAKAINIELARAKKDLEQIRTTAAQQVKTAFEVSAADFVEKIAQKMKQFVGTAEDKVSADRWFDTLHEYYAAADRFLADLDERLGQRFDLTNRSTVSERREILLPNWEHADYDVQLNRVLIANPDVGEYQQPPDDAELGPLLPYTLSWANLNRLVIRELKAAQPTDLSQVNNLSDLLGYWINKKENIPEGIARVAEALCDACHRVLATVGGVPLDQFADGSIIDLLMRDKQFVASRQKYIQKLVDGSGCYLPSISEQRIDRGFMPEFRNIYGQDASGAGVGQQDAEALRKEVEAAARTLQGGDRNRIHNHTVGTKPSLVLCREMAGFPLQYYSRLSELYEAYAKQPVPRSECHINYRETWEDLPDIGELDDQSYAHIRDNVENVLLCIIFNHIVFEDDAYYIKVPKSQQLGTRRVRLGTRINRIIKHACEDDAVRRYIDERVQTWVRGADAAKWAVLYASLLETYHDTEGNEYAVQLTNAAPPVQNCVTKLIEKVTDKLQAAPGGAELYDRLRPANDSEPDHARRHQDQQRRLEAIRTRCLARVGPALPIYRLTATDLSFLDAPEVKEASA